MSADTTRIRVRLTPRGGADRVDGISEEGEVRVRVRAPAVDGTANAALLKLLADLVGVPASAVTLESGHRARRKVVSLGGVDVGTVTRLWPGVTVVDAPRRRGG